MSIETILHFFNEIKHKKIVLFGTGSTAKRLCALLPMRIAYCVDNNSEKQGQYFHGLVIKSPAALCEEQNNKIAIIVASQFYQQISEQLKQWSFIEGEEFWNGFYLLQNVEHFIADEREQAKLLSNLYTLHQQLHSRSFVMKDFLPQILSTYDLQTAVDQRKLNVLFALNQLLHEKKQRQPQGLYEISLCNYYAAWHKTIQRDKGQGGLLSKIATRENGGKIVIWGTATTAWCLLADAEISGVEIVAFIGNPIDVTETIMGIPVILPKELLLHQRNIDAIILSADETNEAEKIRDKIKTILGADSDIQILFWRDIVSLDKSNEIELNKTIFSDIYQLNGFNGTDSLSGPGSDDTHSKTIRNELPLIIKEFGIKSILDLPCGDFYWMKTVDMHALDFYIGGDLVPELIEKIQFEYSNAKRNFIVLDITKDELPKVDLIFCRDCFIHLPNKQIIGALNNIKKSRSKYLMTTTYVDHDQNVDIMIGEARCINLEIAPFSLPKPVHYINEQYIRNNGQFEDRSMAIWKIKDL